MIPLVTVTGFLGSGKTTFLQRVIETNPARKLAFLVNDFGAADVDGRVLSEVSDRVVALPGGSIFCRCLATSFIGSMRELAERCHTTDSPLTGALVEASGISDPRVLPQMLAETGLDKTYRLVRLITLIDPGTFGPLLHTLPNITAQVEAASVAIVNKVDLFEENALAQTERAVREIKPSIEILRAQRADCPLVDCEALFGAGPTPDAQGTYAPCRDPHYARAHWKSEQPVEAERLRAGLTDLGEGLYRAKGLARTDRGCFRLDMTAGQVAMQDAADNDQKTNLVLIYDPSLERQVNDLAATLGVGRE